MTSHFTHGIFFIFHYSQSTWENSIWLYLLHMMLYNLERWDVVLYCDMTTRNHKTLQVEDHPPNNNCCFWYLHVQKFLCFVSITNFLPCWLRKRKLFSCECANVCCSIELRWLELSLTRLTISNTTHTATSNAEFEGRYYSAKTWIHCRR